MEIHEVYNITATQDDCLLIDVDYTGLEGRERTIVAYRASDHYGRLTSVITQYLNDNNPEILPYIPLVDRSPEKSREQMLSLTPRQFRDALIDADIMPDQVTAAIEQIPDEKQRAKALNAWEYTAQFTRTDPLIDQVGFMFSLTPEQIDVLWQGAIKI